jgi:hypothetical protein
MTVYQCLVELNELGYLKPLIKKGVISFHYIQWMEIENYSLEHPNESLAEISYNFSGTKSTIFRALEFMNQPLT